MWLAGPLSGLIIQPIVGVFSDSIDWKWGRRRPFIVTGAALMIVSMYMVAYAREIATLLTGHWSQKPGSVAGELTEEFKEAYADAVSDFRNITDFDTEQSEGRKQKKKGGESLISSNSCLSYNVPLDVRSRNGRSESRSLGSTFWTLLSTPSRLAVGS